MPLVISQHLLNVFVQLANKRGLKKKYEYGTQNVRSLYTAASLMTVSKELSKYKLDLVRV
jgi:hypothetical protein